jgi:hypothetical protein
VGAAAMSAIIVDPIKVDPDAPVTLEQTLRNSAQFQPWLLFRDESKFHVYSGDEYAYEYVEHERSYYVDTNMQKGMLVLPPNPRDGFKLIVSDYFGSWIYHPLIIHRNGKMIMGLEEHMTCDVPNMIFALIYTNTSAGWVVSQNLSTSELANKVKKGPFQ